MTVTGATNVANSVLTTSGDHHFSTNDYVTLSNAAEYQITVLSGTTFSVPANVSGAGITSANKHSGRKFSLWRTGYTVYTADWIMRQGIWTDPGSVYAWIDKFCGLMILLNVDDSTFVADPTKFGWYPLAATMDGKYTTAWHDSFALMDRNSFGSGFYYDNPTGANHPGETGDDDGYHESEDSSVYSGHIAEREVFYRIGVRRGLANAASAITRINSVTDYAAHRNSANDNRGYAVEFGDESD